MNIIRQIYVRINEIALLLILTLLPFSYKSVNIKWIVLFSILLGICVFLLISKQIKPKNFRIWGVFFTMLFLLIFDRAEKINIIRFIPLSTVLFAIAALAFMVRIVVESKVQMIKHSYIHYFFSACLFLFVSMTLFFPFFFHNYQMSLGSNVHLLNNMVKYVILFLLISNYLSEEKKFNRMNIGFILSFTVTIILSILL